ncbi:MAG: hypothetical protein JKY26_08960 [Pseudomonas sp.]|nr:hypothetical protein [Pseudomonas sp.]PHR10901.1 MAG: hypothetical protein COA41_20555 [Sphingopyxis sp.]|tara:strand:+ start:385 stop:1065 length:681 start_codon:yes stop_codon:yes gene_type:complete
MKPYRVPFTGPYFDTYRIGFRLYQPDQRNWRQRTIAGVSWNGRSREAFFFNPDGLVLPLEPHPWELPDLLGRHTLHREFARVMGAGIFAMGAARRKALPSSIGEWATYWLVERKAPYSNDAAAWSSYVEEDLKAEQLAAEASYASASRIKRSAPSSFEWDADPGVSDAAIPEDGARAAAQKVVEARRLLLQKEYTAQCAEDQRIAHWLSGGPEQPSLLAMVQGGLT